MNESYIRIRTKIRENDKVKYKQYKFYKCKLVKSQDTYYLEIKGDLS